MQISTLHTMFDLSWNRDPIDASTLSMTFDSMTCSDNLAIRFWNFVILYFKRLVMTSNWWTFSVLHTDRIFNTHESYIQVVLSIGCGGHLASLNYESWQRLWQSGDEKLLYSGVEPYDSGYCSPAMHFQFIPVLVNCSSTVIVQKFSKWILKKSASVSPWKKFPSERCNR